MKYKYRIEHSSCNLQQNAECPRCYDVRYFLFITKSKSIMCIKCIEEKEKTDPVFALGLESSVE